MILSATGHRSDKCFINNPYGQDNFKILIRFAKSQIRELNPEKVISGMALGWDQAVALAAMGLDIPVVAAVPCHNQEKLWKSPAYQDLYRQLLKKSSEVIYVHDGEYTKTCMHDRNIWMVNHSDEVLELWNGTFGGTMHCHNYATKQGKPIHNTWNDWVEYRDQHE